MFALLLLASAPALLGEDVVETWPDGTVRARYTVDEGGKRTGSYQEFHENGTRSVRATYKAGELTGSYQEFYPSGKKALDCKYKAGALHGKYLEWDEKGKPLWVCKYDGGLLDGKCEAFEGGERLVTQLWKEAP